MSKTSWSCSRVKLAPAASAFARSVASSTVLPTTQFVPPVACVREGGKGRNWITVVHVRLAPGPRFGQSRPGICAPTTTAGRCTNLGYSPATCTTPPRRFLGRLPVLQLWSSDTPSDLTLVEFHVTAHLDRLFCQRFAVHPPLWLEHRFDDVSRFTVPRE